jgi:hypothetical protein
MHQVVMKGAVGRFRHNVSLIKLVQRLSTRSLALAKSEVERWLDGEAVTVVCDDEASEIEFCRQAKSFGVILIKPSD